MKPFISEVPVEEPAGKGLLDQLDDRQLHEAMVGLDRENFLEWDKKLLERTSHIIAYNQFMAENSKQWGSKPGVNSGNGQFEGSMSLQLFLALGSKDGPFANDPDWWKDDSKFYKWLRSHPWHDGRPGHHKSQGANHSGGRPC